MKEYSKDWDELLTYEKVSRILTMVFGVATIVLAILSESGSANMVIMHLCSGLMLLCQAISFWREHRGVGIFSLIASVFMLLTVLITTFF